VRGTVFIAEDIGDAPYELTGRFTAHWEASEGNEHRDGPQGVPVEEAIAWGRAQSDTVLVRRGVEDIFYSAGTGQTSLPVWPEGTRVERRRWPGMEHLDLVADEPIPWEVRLPRRVPAADAEHDQSRLLDALTRDPDVSEVRGEIERGADWTAVVLRFVVRARSHDEAMRLVLAIEKRCCP
jgi:hypothetical protein